MAKVLVRRGELSDRVIENVTFEFVRGLSIGMKGPFITVNGSGVDGFPPRNFRVGIQNLDDFSVDDPSVDMFRRGARQVFQQSTDPKILQFVGQGDVFEQIESRPLYTETDAEIRQRITERFHVLRDLTTDAARGNVKGLVVWGASGMGKSYEVIDSLGRDSLMDKLAFDPTDPDQNKRRIGQQGRFKPRYNVVKGFSTPAALYQTLYESSEARETLVFDDCDSIFGNEDALNLLKGVLDTTGTRTISWGTSSRNNSDIPSQFDFKGAVIFISNINFESIVEKGTARLAPHMAAIMDRCLCLDLTIDTMRERLVRIEHVSRDLRMLEQQFKLDNSQVDEVLKWTYDNARRFRNLSLRKVGQLASIRVGQQNWERVAEITLLKR